MVESPEVGWEVGDEFDKQQPRKLLKMHYRINKAYFMDRKPKFVK